MRIKILIGDCREVLRPLTDESVHCVVTSPPYWGLRDYGTATWEGGDYPGCEHVVGEIRTGLGMAALGEQYRGGGHKAAESKPITAKSECPHCGARRIDSQLGREPTYQEYVANMVEVFREVRRVLRKDGTAWLNLGDSYAGGGHGGGGSFERERNWRKGNPQKTGGNSNRDGLGRGGDLKPKDLCGIPWRVAFALQVDGWYLRQDIIWSKPNPMPESVTDRCTKAHEYIFLLSKSAQYYYDAEAIKQAGSDNSHGGAPIEGGGPKRLALSQRGGGRLGIPSAHNKRSVWEVATQPFPEAHFATFPPALIEPCIKAGCPPGGTVLDPFGGAGSTGLAADRLGRHAILIELNPEYAAMAERRIRNDAGMFAQVAHEA